MGLLLAMDSWISGDVSIDLICLFLIVCCRRCRRCCRCRRCGLLLLLHWLVLLYWIQPWDCFICVNWTTATASLLLSKFLFRPASICYHPSVLFSPLLFSVTCCTFLYQNCNPRCRPFGTRHESVNVTVTVQQHHLFKYFCQRTASSFRRPRSRRRSSLSLWSTRP